MIKGDNMSNAQSWELEIVCKNKKYLDAVVSAVLKRGLISFEVEIVEFFTNHDGSIDGRYLVLMWSSWFHNLSPLATDLQKIEEELDDF